MRVVDLGHKVRNRELELVGPKPSCLGLGAQGGGARRENNRMFAVWPITKPARLQKRRRKRRMLGLPTRENSIMASNAAAFRLPRDIDIVRTGFFECQSNELARGPGS